MASFGVLARGTLLSKAVSVRALAANCSPTTQISQRLATKLGLTQFKPVYITDEYAAKGEFCLKWKVSLVPIMFQATDADHDQQLIVSYPIVNCNDDDAFWEMIIGVDCWNQYKRLIFDFRGNQKPTPGPSHEENIDYMGHNIRLCDPSEVPKNEFYEYPCTKFSTISRIAIHKANRQLVVVFTATPDKVFQFSNLSEEHEAQIEEPDGGATDEVLEAIKQSCPSVEIESFPENATLLCAELKMQM
jgi:hypothetical protein